MFTFAANLSMLFTETDWADRFVRARRAGFRAVEIQFPYEIAVGELKKHLKNNELSLCLINLPAHDLMQGGLGLACVPSRKQAFRAALETALPYLDTLNIPRVNILAGRIDEHISKEAAWDTLLENLEFAATRLEALGVTVLCEAINPFDVKGYLVNTGDDMLKLAQTLNRKNFAAQVDIYHFARQNLDACAWIRQHFEWVEHIQFADCPNRGEPSTGTINFHELFSTLKTLGYKKITAAEYRPSKKTEETLSWLHTNI